MEYRYTTGWKIFMVLLAAFWIGVGIFVIFITPDLSADSWKGPILLLATAFAVIGAILCLDIFRTKVAIDDRTMSVTRAFKTKEILLSDIAGYRRGNRERFAVESREGGKRLDIPTNLQSRKELVVWIASKYTELDARENAEETAVLLEDGRYGLTREEREARLAMAKKLDTAATIVGFGLVFWSVFFPEPFELVMIVSFVAPWLAVVATWYFKGLLKLYKAKKSPYPSLVFLMGLPVVGTLIAVMRFYKIYTFGQNAWTILFAGAVLATGLFVAGCWQAIRPSKKKVATYLCVLVMAAIYIFSMLTFANCYYDKSPSKMYNVTVTGKRVSHGKSTSYYVTLSPWGHFTKDEEESVTKDFFEDVQEQDSIKVFLNEGKYGVPWYHLQH